MTIRQTANQPNFDTNALQWIPAGEANPQPGWLIYVMDNKHGKETRVNNRLMVVLRRNDTWSMTCLSLCHHKAPPDTTINWPVCMAGAPRESIVNATSTDCLSIVLKCDDVSGEIKPGITVNVRDIWNVEYEVSVLVVGWVEPASLLHLKRKVQDVFWETLDQAIPEPKSKPKEDTRAVKVQVHNSGHDRDRDRKKEYPKEGKRR